MDMPHHSHLAENITHFARALRRAGVPVGPARLIAAQEAVMRVGFSERMDFFHTLRACLVSRPEHLPLYAQTFNLYWRDPQFLEKMMRAFSPMMHKDMPAPKKKAAEKRAAEALLDAAPPPKEQPAPRAAEEELVIDAAMTLSTEERLRRKDFEQMTLAELDAARRAIARMRLPVAPMQARRFAAHPGGPHIDPRATLCRAMRTGEVMALARQKRRTRWPNLVALCDISGSMASYSRMLLHFLHAASQSAGQGWAEVHSFTFGTQLTNITRYMRGRDVDQALDAAGAVARDWEGGTQIGACLDRFNRDWSRRVLGQGAVVLLITDGLERDKPDLLRAAAERLQLTARSVIWLNPLMRWDKFEPKAAGMKALLPFCNELVSAHSIDALEDLADLLTSPGTRLKK